MPLIPSRAIASSLTHDSAATTLALNDAICVPSDEFDISTLNAQQQVASPTQTEIQNYYRSLAINITSEPAYSSTPQTTNPYTPGLLSQESLNNGLNMLNFVRYVAGIPSAITLSSSYIQSAQAAALVNAANYANTGTLSLSHTPTKPTNMNSDLYDLGYAGSQSSNLAVGYKNPAASILGYMNDSDSSNIQTLGHRRWCLNPNMQTTGFGQVNNYSAMYVLDGASLTVPYETVIWPAANMPTALFDSKQAWSVSLDFAPYGNGFTQAIIKRQSDGKTWNMSNGSSDGDFYTSINGTDGFRGSGSCVIFRPNDISYRIGDTFEVTLTGINGKELRYTVNFFDLGISQSMYRMYNPNSGEHFYTAREAERDMLIRSGWKYEGIGWESPTKSQSPVYRLYSGTDHHYTLSAAERDMLIGVGWSYEGIGWYSDDNKGIPLYRQFNPNVQPSAPFNNSGSHNYTMSKTENDWLVAMGWRAEGVGWYGCK